MMKKTLLIAAVSTLSLSISSVCSAGNIEKAERYAAPLNVVERAFDGDVKFMSNPEVQELGGLLGGSPCFGAE
jgi:hypothetical protein